MGPTVAAVEALSEVIVVGLDDGDATAAAAAAIEAAEAPNEVNAEEQSDAPTAEATDASAPNDEAAEAPTAEAWRGMYETRTSEAAPEAEAWQVPIAPLWLLYGCSIASL